MTHPVEIRLQARGLDLAGLRWNPGAPARLLCVHGWLDNAASFGALAALLTGDMPKKQQAGLSDAAGMISATAVFDIVALDLPGHGRSAHRGAGHMQHFIEYVADVVAVLDALDWHEAVLIGHSLGAGVMACVAGVVPERVRALLLIEGIAPQPALPEKILESLRAAIDATRRGAGESAGYPDMQAAVVARRKGFWPLSDAVSERILERALTRGGDGQLRWHTDPRLRQPSALRLVEGQVSALLGAITCPTMLIGAEAGLFASHVAHAARIDDVKSLQYVTLVGGHHLHLEPETAPAVATLVRDFLMRHVGT